MTTRQELIIAAALIVFFVLSFCAFIEMFSAPARPAQTYLTVVFPATTERGAKSAYRPYTHRYLGGKP